MKRIVKSLALFMAVIMLMCIFSACGKKEEPETQREELMEEAAEEQSSEIVTAPGWLGENGVEINYRPGEPEIERDNCAELIDDDYTARIPISSSWKASVDADNLLDFGEREIMFNIKGSFPPTDEPEEFYQHFFEFIIDGDTGYLIPIYQTEGDGDFGEGCVIRDKDGRGIKISYNMSYDWYDMDNGGVVFTETIIFRIPDSYTGLCYCIAAAPEDGGTWMDFENLYIEEPEPIPEEMIPCLRDGIVMGVVPEA